MYVSTHNKRPLSESEKRSCPTQLNSVSKKHFLLLEGRRLGFCQRRWPGCAGAHGHVWCILPTLTVGWVCRDMCDPKLSHNTRVPGAWTASAQSNASRAGGWGMDKRGEEPDKRHQALKTRATSGYQSSQISHIKSE